MCSCASVGSCMLRAKVEVVSFFVDSEAFTRACVVLELAEVQTSILSSPNNGS